MFSQTDCVVKVVSLSIDLDWIGGASKRLPKSAIADLGLVAPKNQVDDATFSSSRFAKDNDVSIGFLRNSTS
jgi:hypothetical protein